MAEPGLLERLNCGNGAGRPRNSRTRSACGKDCRVGSRRLGRLTSVAGLSDGTCSCNRPVSGLLDELRVCSRRTCPAILDHLSPFLYVTNDPPPFSLTTSLL